MAEAGTTLRHVAAGEGAEERCPLRLRSAQATANLEPRPGPERAFIGLSCRPFAPGAPAVVLGATVSIFTAGLLLALVVLPALSVTEADAIWRQLREKAPDRRGLLLIDDTSIPTAWVPIAKGGRIACQEQRVFLCDWLRCVDHKLQLGCLRQ